MTVTLTPTRIILDHTVCTFPREDENGYRTDLPCGWEGIEEFAVFDDTEEVIGFCPECGHELYLPWETV